MMHWQLPVALLLTTFVCSAYSQCHAFADGIEIVDNRKSSGEVKNHAIKFTVKNNRGALNSTEEKFVSDEIGKGVSTMASPSKSFPSKAKKDAQKQMSSISKGEWLDRAEQSMNKEEEKKEVVNIPPKSIVYVFQARLVCGDYEMSLPKIMLVWEKI